MALTPVERMLRRVLIHCARQRRTITYTALADRLRPVSPVTLEKPFSPMHHWLGHVSAYEHRNKRPLLSALVVRAGHGTPGPGFEEWAVPTELAGLSWEELRDDVFDHWCGQEEDTPVDEVGEVVFDDYGLRVKVELGEDSTLRLIIGDAPYGIDGVSLRRNSKGNAVITLAPQLPHRPPA